MKVKIGRCTYTFDTPGAISYWVYSPTENIPQRYYYLVNWDAPTTKGQIERLVSMARGCRSKARPAEWSMTRREAKNLIKLCKATNDLRTLLDGWQTAEDWKNRVARTTNNKWKAGHMKAMLK